MTAAEFRRMALRLEGAEEKAHMHHPDFRVRGKIFATLGYPDETRGMVKLFPDQQEVFVAADPAAFQPVKGAWGRQGCTQVILKAAKAERVQEALTAAWERAAPQPAAEKKRATARRRGGRSSTGSREVEDGCCRGAAGDAAREEGRAADRDGAEAATRGSEG